MPVIAIVVEKPSVAKKVAPIARAVFPGATLLFPLCWVLGQFSPPLPRGLKWKDYPFIAPFNTQDFKPNPASPFMLGRPGAGGEVAFVKGQGAYERAWRQADEIIGLVDPSDSLYRFDVARQKILGAPIQAGEGRLLYSMDVPSIKRALEGQEPGEEPKVRELIAYGQVRHYFNHQFAINSLAVLGKTAQTHAWVSKYQLQLLFLMRHWSGATEAEVIRMMGKYTGTGKYTSQQGVGIGSFMSRSKILEQVLEHQWLEKQGNALALSSKGEQMLRRLHPGCEDPDLPFRIHQWANQGLSISRSAMDRYIRTFFGRQKRVLDRLG